MTTIAYAGGVMASDSCMTCDGVVDALVSKIQRLRSGALLGSAGDNDGREIEALLGAVKSPRGLPTRSALLQLRLDYVGLIVFPNGEVFKISTTNLAEAHWDAGFAEDVGAWPIPQRLAAIGTGGLAARVAMLCGKTPAQAVAIACRVDINSRLPVHSLKLKR